MSSELLNHPSTQYTLTVSFKNNFEIYFLAKDTEFLGERNYCYLVAFESFRNSRISNNFLDEHAEDTFSLILNVFLFYSQGSTYCT